MKVDRFGVREYSTVGRAYAACRRMEKPIRVRVNWQNYHIFPDGRAVPLCCFFDYRLAQ